MTKQTDVDALFKSAETLAMSFAWLGYYVECADLLERASQSLEKAGNRKPTVLARIRILCNLGWLYVRLGRTQEAENLADQCRISTML